MSTDRPGNGAPRTPEFERITPLSRSGSATASPISAQHRRHKTVGAPIVLIAALALGALAIGVFFFLPKNVDRQPASTPRPAPSEQASATPTETAAQAPVRQTDSGAGIEPWQRAQLERERGEAEEVLAKLVDRQFELEERAVTTWAPDEFEQARAAAERGDDFFATKDYRGAAGAYTEALELLETLTDRVDEVLAEAIRTGLEAISAGDAAAAAENFQLALAIDPGNGDAGRGLARAGKLDQVLELMATGQQHEEAGELEPARKAYQQAAELDPVWTQAGDSVARINKRLAASRYQQSVSAGFAALAGGNYGAAQESFRDALRLRPNSAEAADGLAQAELNLRLEQFGRYRRLAEQAEDAERWQDAVDNYKAVLKHDETTLFAREGYERARARADLDEQMTKYIEDPKQLSDQLVYATAIGVRNQAAAIPDPGPQLLEQVAKLSVLIEQAGAPILVRLESDNATEVVLYKIGRLGSFTTHNIELRPGTYTAVGTRDGYRDVRRQFTVVAGETPPSIVIRCEEKI